jgi:TetR/AcrR family transcriptional regulator
MPRRKHASQARPGSRRQPEASRNSILQAALVEFAQHGLAGARMDAIAQTAGVNKALLYYYFHDKEHLYGAILDRFFIQLLDRVMAVCDQPGSAGHRFLSYARTHFDAIAESPYYARIFMGELMSTARGGSPHFDRLFAKYLQPIAARVLALVQEGVTSAEFRPVDPNQFLPSAIGSIVHYFLTAPLREKFMPQHHASTAQAIQQRRAAVLDFIAAALFTDREAGIVLAEKIAAQPTARPRRASATPRKKMAKQRGAPASSISPSAPPPPPAPQPEQPPIQAMDPEADASRPPTGYTWINRWFPDFETARKVLEEEKRVARSKHRKSPATSGDQREPK